MSGSSTGALIGLILALVGAAVVIKIIDDVTKEKRYVCPTCGHTLRKGSVQCPSCKTPLRWA